MIYLKNDDFVLNSNHSIIHSFQEKGLSWSWSYWYTISVYRHLSCELESHSWRGALDTTICDKMCRWLAAGRGFSRYSGFLHQWNWPPWYNWNIAESGARHHNPNHNPSKSIIFLNKYKYLLPRTSEHYTVTIRGCHVREILIVFYFLLTKYLPLLTLQVAPNSQNDRQAITMANHIFTSKQIHYVYYTSQHWLFWIYVFVFSTC